MEFFKENKKAIIVAGGVLGGIALISGVLYAFKGE